MTLHESLVAAATELLDEGGPDNVTLREVGRRTGVSRTAPYLHFASKSALLATIATRELAALVAEVEAITSEGRPAADVLADAARHYVLWARNRPERFRLVFSAWSEEPDGSRDTATCASEMLVDLVRRTQAEGALPPGDPWQVAATVRALAHGAAVLEQAGHLLGKDRAPLDALDLIGTSLSRYLSR